jgi:branched-chain amino acid transport system ATP-binding protein
VLCLENITVQYGKVVAVKDVTIEVAEGEIIALIGANGAGKSTTLRAISGLVRPSSGKIDFDGHDLTSINAENITKLGIAHVPEGRRVFPLMTVMENLEMGAYLRNDSVSIARDLETVFHHFPRLKDRVGQLAGTMSGGEQQMLAMGRALMSAPKVILMDEPSLGLSPIMCQEIARIIRDIHAPSSWSNRTRAWPWRSPIAATCWKPATSP